MTEQFQQWAISKYPGDLRRKSVPEMADFWLSAFVREVERHYHKSGTFGSVMGAEAAKGRAFAQAVRDFGLEEKP